MRIVSTFRDYYDSAMAFGVDTTNVYVREPAKHDIPEDLKRCMRSTGWNINYLVVCGKVYPLLINEKEQAPGYDIVYGLDNILNAIRDKRSGNRFYWPYERAPILQTLEMINAEDLHLQYKSPIIFIGRSDYINVGLGDKAQPSLNSERAIFTNIFLKHLDFQKMLDPYTMFQEIEMYRSGVLCNTEDNMVTISDVDKRDKKGFDEFSFKKAPTKKRK